MRPRVGLQLSASTFSLLEGLDPADISLLQSNADQKLPHLVGSRRNIQKGEAHGDFFSPINPFAGKRHFDIFVCNPPWRESGDDEAPTWEAWCREQAPPYPVGRRQIAAGFAYRAMQSVKPDGVVTLIMPLNLMVGATSQSFEFRQRWLEDARIERIINFGDVRRLLFPAAKHPFADCTRAPSTAGRGRHRARRRGSRILGAQERCEPGARTNRAPRDRPKAAHGSRYLRQAVSPHLRLLG